jgi:hypothetical protein
MPISDVNHTAIGIIRCSPQIKSTQYSTGIHPLHVKNSASSLQQNLLPIHKMYIHYLYYVGCFLKMTMTTRQWTSAAADRPMPLPLLWLSVVQCRTWQKPLYMNCKLWAVGLLRIYRLPTSLLTILSMDCSFYCEDWGSRFLLTAGKFLPEYTILQDATVCRNHHQNLISQTRNSLWGKNITTYD